MEHTVKTVLSSMSNIKKPQINFMLSLFDVLVVFQGRATFTNLSRYSSMNEKRFRRWSKVIFNYAEFNGKLISQLLPRENEKIAAIDASFLSKSGSKTEGLGWYYNGSAGEAQRGLEISTICITDLKSNTAYSLDSRQTVDTEEMSRVDQYAQHVADIAADLHRLNIRYIAADAYYSKVKFVSKVLEANLHIVGKLRVDADLYWLNHKKSKGVGRPKKYNGKIYFEKDLQLFDAVGELDSKVSLYTKVVYSKSLKQEICVVMLRWKKEGGFGHALLYSTDKNIEAKKLVQYYKARFQIEFLFRDAKQNTGLTHCQSTRKEATNMQVNASLTALNLLKFEDREEKNTGDKSVISIASWKRRKFNQHLMCRVFNELGLDMNCKKISKIYRHYSHYGAISA